MECGRVEKVEGAGMKITFEVPDDAIALSLTYLWECNGSYMIGTHNEVDFLEDGSVIKVKGKGGEADET